MKLFERYVASLTLGVFVAMAFGLVSLFLVIDFGDWLRIYTGKPVIDVVTLYWYRSHLALVQFAPAALVLASGLTITVVRRRGEWTALRALGAAPITLLRPVLIVALVASMALVVFQEFVVSESGPRVDRIMVERFDRWGDFVAVYSPRRWFKAGEALVNVRGDANPEKLQDVRVFELGPKHALVGWTDAATLTYVSNGRWRADEAHSIRFAGDTVVSDERGSFELPLPLAPEITQLAVGRPEWMPLTRLSKQVELMRALDLPTESTRFAIHQRWAMPFAAVVAAFIAAMLGLRSKVKASVPRTLLEGAGLYGGLFVAGMISRSLAINARLPPFAAAWLLPVVLSLAAAWIFFKTQERNA